MTEKSPQSTDNIVNEISTRRGFLMRAAVTAIAGGAVAACKESSAQRVPVKAGASLGSKPAPVPALSATEAMDKMHEAGVKAFPAKTAGKGNVPLAPRIERGMLGMVTAVIVS